MVGLGCVDDNGLVCGYRVTVVGCGRVASALCRSLSAAGCGVVMAGRDEERVRRVAGECGVAWSALERIEPSDIVVIAVSDDAVSQVGCMVADRLAGSGAVVAHTSGTVSMSALDGRLARGVFYPLLSFTGGDDDFAAAPLLIEGDSADSVDRLSQLARVIGSKWAVMGSQERGRLHLAAVFANNFVVRMQALACGWCRENGIDYDLLKPLIATAAVRTTRPGVDPADCQSGPAARGDISTIAGHRALLEGHDDMLRVYDAVTRSIMGDRFR